MAGEYCDHKSVGILVFRDGRLLLINRKKPPFGLACPAGHVDNHGSAKDPLEKRYEAAARDELEEETGLVAAEKIFVIGQGRRNNPCRREGGTWHYWRVYQAVASGDLRPSMEETRGYLWCDKETLEKLLQGKTLALPQGETGLEPVWAKWLTRLKALERFPV